LGLVDGDFWGERKTKSMLRRGLFIGEINLTGDGGKLVVEAAGRFNGDFVVDFSSAAANGMAHLLLFSSSSFPSIFFVVLIRPLSLLDSILVDEAK
jgi:hypothetical protein